MKESLSKDEVYELWYLLAITTETMRKARKSELAEYGIIPRRAAVLDMILKLGGKAKPGEISRMLLRECHSVHEILRRMEKDGLLKKINDPNRKNGVLVTLTEEGFKAHRLLEKRKSLRRIMSSLSKRKREQLKSYLKVLLEKSQDEIEEENKQPVKKATPKKRKR
jgi:DNA-binding MarR family transcriptional regulator